MTDIQNKNILSLINKFSVLDSAALRTLLKFKPCFLEKLKHEKGKLYRLNVLDEIRVNSGIIENAHNRILAEILDCNPDTQQYPVLQSFLKHLGSPFSELKVSQPEITAEEDRIDVRIRDTDYSIIIENKIKGATDQPRQIERYIEKEKRTKNIHVLYLTKEGGSPDKGSLSEKVKKEFEERYREKIVYREINYKEHIMPWLKKFRDEEMPGLPLEKDSVFESGIIQYLNHIEGLFNSRKGEQEMNNKMKALVKEHLKLDSGSFEDQIGSVEDHLEYANELSKYLKELKMEIFNENIVKNLKGVEISPVDDTYYCYKWETLEWKNGSASFQLVYNMSNREPDDNSLFIAIKPKLKSRLKEIRNIMQSQLGWQESEIQHAGWDRCWCFLKHTNTGCEVDNPEAVAKSIKAVIKKINESKELKEIMQ